MKKVLSMLVLLGILCILSGCGNVPSAPTKCDYEELYCTEGYESEYLYDCNFYYIDEESSGQIGALYIADTTYVNFQFQNGVITKSQKLQHSPYTTFHARRETDAQKELLSKLCDAGSIPDTVLDLENNSRYYWNYRDYTIVLCDRSYTNESPILIRYDSGTGDHAITYTLSDSTQLHSLEPKRYGSYFSFGEDQLTIDLTAMTPIDSFEAPALTEYEQSDILNILASVKFAQLDALMQSVRTQENFKCGRVDGFSTGVALYFEADGTTYLLECDKNLQLQKVMAFSVGEWTLSDIYLHNDGYDWFYELD